MKCCIFSEETQTEKHTRTKKYTLVNPNPEAVFHGERQAGKEGDLKAGETCAL